MRSPSRVVDQHDGGYGPCDQRLGFSDLTVFLLYGMALQAVHLDRPDTAAAEQAVPLLRTAVDHFGPAYARFRGFYLPDLAGAHALAGDLDIAVTVGHQAVDAVASLSSPRAHDRLRTLHTVLGPMHASPGVADLRDRLTMTAA